MAVGDTEEYTEVYDNRGIAKGNVKEEGGYKGMRLLGKRKKG